MKENYKQGPLTKGHQSEKHDATLIPRANVNETTFRALITGAEHALPVVARAMKKFLVETHKITKLKIHFAEKLTEEIAQKLKANGLHAVIMCTDTSQSFTRLSIHQTIQHLSFNLLSNSVFIMDLIQPSMAVFPSVTDAVEKLCIKYNLTVVNILLEDEASVLFGVGRIATAALLASKFIHGYEPTIFKNIDFTQVDDSAL